MTEKKETNLTRAMVYVAAEQDIPLLCSALYIYIILCIQLLTVLYVYHVTTIGFFEGALHVNPQMHIQNLMQINHIQSRGGDPALDSSD